jgi:hypothetical protein
MLQPPVSRITTNAGRCPSYREPMDAQAQERQAGRNAQALAQDYAMSWYNILVCVLPFLLPDICRTEDL